MRQRPRAVLRAVLMLTLAVPTLMAALGQQVPMEKLEALKPRAIGPAGMSGRVTSIAVVPNNPNTFYIGTASGGLWKTESGGISWTPLFDTMAVASIGAVALDPGNPSVVWVGTGEGNPRNSQTNGNGVYRSLDGGKTWKHLGLDQTRNIHRVIVHPGNPQVVYVGAIGAAWGDSPDRGVYRTTDGGKSWKKILYLNNRTGVADLVMDPTNPNKLIAAMWDYRRWPWFFSSGGKGSGLHVTFDNGGGRVAQRHTGKNRCCHRAQPAKRGLRPDRGKEEWPLQIRRRRVHLEKTGRQKHREPALLLL
jgi:hypothetical protein